MTDLVVLVADKNAQFAIKGALNRSEALEMRSVEFEIRVHPGRDGGVRRSGAQLLAVERRRFSKALMLLDYEGCGANEAPSTLESGLDEELNTVWGERAKAIVIEPEVDIWMWGSDNAIEEVIGWRRGEKVRAWLQNKGFQFRENQKPVRPKEALEALLREPGIPRSAALYEQIASKISLKRCTDAAFERLTARLREWFPK
jgi:hypothetical protein